MVAAAARRGFRLSNYDTDQLSQGYYIDYHYTLQRNVRYIIFAAGDDHAQDVDIYLYDENGNLIDRDRQPDNSPVVEVTPRWTGPFTVRIKMYQAYGVGSYTMGVLYYCGCSPD
jgi:hypothetical protein